MAMPSKRTRLLASTILIGAVFGAGASAQAQQASADQGTTVKEVVVTGSRIRQPNLTTASPVTSVNSQEVKLEGTQRVEDLVNNLPQVFASQGSTYSNGGSGTATVNLRGLGCTRTLVLIDGRRMAAGDPSVPCADLNFIPASMIERVDVETGGASAVYGSDALGGVVNFVMKKNFEGVQIDVNHSMFNHDNGDSYAQGLLATRQAQNPAQFKVPSSTFWGGDSTDINITVGTNSPDGKGNVTAYFGYRQTEPVTEAPFDYSACSLNLNGSGGFVCGGSSTSNPPRLKVLSDAVNQKALTGNLTIDPKTGAIRPFTASDQYNYAPYNYFERNDTRYTGGFFAHYDVSKEFQVYSQFMFMDDTTTAQIAASGAFYGSPFMVSCSNNPLMTAAEQSTFCLSPDANGNQAMYIGRRNTEGGPRQDDLHHTDFRMVLGAKGDLNDTWSYDVYGQYSQSNLSENYQHDMSMVRINRALQVVNVKNGAIVPLGTPGATAMCQSAFDGTDNNCVPWNIWTPGGVTQAALNYLQAPGFQEAVDTEQVVSGYVTGKLGNYGVKSPWANDGVSLVIGGEYRRETQDFRTDAEFQSGDLAGQGGPRIGEAGAFNVKELFLETRVPLISDKPFVKDLSLDGAYRRSDYSSSGTTDTYMIEANWTPVRDIRVRGSFNRAVRAPNVLELFTPQSIGLQGSTDPCSGAAPKATAAQCAHDPYFAANPGAYGHVDPNPASQYNGLGGGNTHLRPEVGDTTSVGVVLQPRWVPGFSLTLDWFDIKGKGFIGGIGADTILNECYNFNQFCNLIHRSPGNGSLWTGDGTLANTGYVINTNQNVGATETRGVDVQANYRMPLSKVGLNNMGSVDFDLQGTYNYYLFSESIQGDPSTAFTCQGLYGPQCGIPNPYWRHKARVTWVTPWKVTASLQWRYFGGVKLDKLGSSGGPDQRLPAYNWIDLAATWRVRDNLELRAGVNNVFDKDPPIISGGNLATGPLNGNTAPSVYDAMGRSIFMGLTANF